MPLKNINFINNYRSKYYYTLLLIIAASYLMQSTTIQLPKMLINRMGKPITLGESANYSVYTINKFTINNSYNNYYLEKKLVAKYLSSYLKCKQLPKLVQRSRTPIRYILAELKKRNLPRELALLPIIESSYQSTAISRTGASGIWQISRIAGKHYGLIYSLPTGIKDKRFDLIASTEVALAYLELLYKRFNQDWLLALAAYNAGEGRVSQAIKHNKSLGKGTSYWDLDLPKETKNYVPKILALSIIFNNPTHYGLNFQEI